MQIDLSPFTSLALALVQHRATSLGINVVAIKGPGLYHHDLRTQRSYADADVLVEPDHWHELIDSLKELGWTERPEIDVPGLLPRHSISLYHNDWPCDIDVHHSFPGLFGADQTVFQTIWKSRVETEVAGQSVVIPGRVASAAIHAAHCLRHPASQRHLGELEILVDRVTNSFSAQQLTELVQFGRETGSLTVMKPFFESVGIRTPGLEDDLFGERAVRWRLYIHTHDDGSLGAWLYRLQTAAWREKPGVLVRALRPTKLQVESLTKGPSEISPGYLVQRFCSAISRFPKTWLTVRRIRRGSPKGS